MKTLLLISLLCIQFFTYSQDPESNRKYRSRLSKTNYFKIDAGQLLMFEFGVNYELNFNNLWSITSSAGINRGSIIYTNQMFGMNILENDFYSSGYKWGYQFSFGLRHYFNKYKEPKGIYSEIEARYKEWSKKEIDPKHGNQSIKFLLEDIQIVPIIGWVPNRSHWIEMYLGLAIVNTTGVAEGSYWVGTGNGDDGSAFTHLKENINFMSYRPKMGFRICF